MGTDKPLERQSPSELPTVLVIDDDDLVRGVICRALKADYRVETAANGRDGLVLMQDLAPDLVITDLRMPIMGGDELVAKVRSSLALRSTAVMVITADSTEEQKISLLRSGVEDYMVKPFSLEELRARVANLLARKGEVDALRFALADHEHAALRERFLSHAGDVLATSGNPREALRALGRLALLALGDVCELEIVAGPGRPAFVHLSSWNTESNSACREVERAARERGRGLLTWKVIERGEAVLAREMNAEQLEAIAVDGAHLNALRELAVHSALAVPLRVRGALLGAMAVVSSSPSLRYEEENVALVEGLADKAAPALEHAYSLSLAQSALEQRDRALTVVTEGLRAPIDRVQACSRLLLRRPGGQPERRALEPVAAIQTAIAEMDRLVSHLSIVRKAEAGCLFADRERTAPAHLVLEVVALSRHLASAHRVALKAELRGEPPEVWLDRPALLAVFAALIENSARHTPPGGRIVVGAEALERQVRFWVSDTGTGISPEELAQLFDRHAPRRVTLGSGRPGLGLLSVKGVVEAHGGKVQVESAVGEGTVFSLLFPSERVLV